MKVIVGLGNPGAKYKGTRHNVGFDCIDYCAEQFGIELTESKFKGAYGKGIVNNEKVFLLKPLTFMNLSGESVRPFIDYYGIDLEDVLVIYDDMDLPTSKVRLRTKGSAGGHNGIKSLIQHLGTPEFNRIRIGVGRPGNGESVINYVLGTYRPEEKDDVAKSIEHSQKAVEAWTVKPFIQVMNEFN